MKTRHFCPKCKRMLNRETHKELRREYPFVCLHCDENFYRIEVLTKKQLTTKTNSHAKKID